MEETKEERAKRLAHERQVRYRTNNPEAGREASRRWRAANPGYRNPQALKNVEVVNALKSEPCTDCHQRFPTACMDFDHIEERGPKINHVGTMVAHNYSLQMILDEIAKCDLVCANCHRIRTNQRSKT